MQAGDDAGALLTKYGTWQPSLHHTRGPPVLDAIVGSLGGVGGERRVLLDVGAGQGLFSLAAAARGHGAIAFELSAMSTSAFQASIAYNGFDDRIHLHEVCASIAMLKGLFVYVRAVCSILMSESLHGQYG